MSYYDQPPVDPIQSHSSYPSSPPSIEESLQGASAYPTSSTGVPRFPQVKLTIKLGRETPTSAPQIMTSSVAYRYGNNEDDRETSGDESNNTPFSGLNAPAVRQRIRAEVAAEAAAAAAAANGTTSSNGGDDNSTADHGSNGNDDTAEEVSATPKKELRERKRVSDAGSSTPQKSSGKKKGKKEKKGKKAKKEVKEEGEEDGEEKEEKEEEDVGEGGEDDGEEPEEYEVERILAHGWGDKGELLYKVKWVGYGPDFDTYEPASELSSAKQRIEEYKRSLPVETRGELVDKKKRGRPSTGRAKPEKEPRTRAKETSESEEEDEKDDDDDFKLEKSGGASTSRSRGRPPKSKGELKLFEQPKSTGPPRKKPFLQNRQGWLDESDSDSDGESKKEKKKDKRVSESPAPKRGRRGGTVDETPAAVTNGARSSRASAGGASGAVIEGMYRHENGEVDVLLAEGRSQRIVPLSEAHEIAGFGLVQFLVDRLQFQP